MLVCGADDPEGVEDRDHTEIVEVLEEGQVHSDKVQGEVEEELDAQPDLDDDRE